VQAHMLLYQIELHLTAFLCLSLQGSWGYAVLSTLLVVTWPMFRWHERSNLYWRRYVLHVQQCSLTDSVYLLYCTICPPRSTM
jgi:hypothetical protein